MERGDGRSFGDVLSHGRDREEGGIFGIGGGQRGDGLKSSEREGSGAGSKVIPRYQILRE